MKKFIVRKKYQEGGSIFDVSQLSTEELAKYNSLDAIGKSNFQKEWGAKSTGVQIAAQGVDMASQAGSNAFAKAQVKREEEGEAPKIGQEVGRQALKGLGKGAKIGAGTGAALGTFLIPIPGVGTAIGGAIGGALGAGAGATAGGISGVFAGKKQKKEYEDEKNQEVLRKANEDINKEIVELKKGGRVITRKKAREILHDGTAHGNPITDKQRRFFGAMANAKGNTPVTIKGKSRKVKHSK